MAGSSITPVIKEFEKSSDTIWKSLLGLGMIAIPTVMSGALGVVVAPIMGILQRYFLFKDAKGYKTEGTILLVISVLIAVDMLFTMMGSDVI